jgi:hypothetical protein
VKPPTNGVDAGLRDWHGGIEVGLARTQANDVLALRLEAGGAGGDGKRWRRLDALDAS